PDEIREMAHIVSTETIRLIPQPWTFRIGVEHQSRDLYSTRRKYEFLGLDRPVCPPAIDNDNRIYACFAGAAIDAHTTRVQNRCNVPRSGNLRPVLTAKI